MMLHDAEFLSALLAWLAGLAAIASLALALCGALLVRRFYAREPELCASLPAVTVLKPLCGDEPRLEAALASICAQHYPQFQIVFGVQDAADPALACVRRLRARFPACDITVIVDAEIHGPNRKVSNLINMLPAARHQLLVFSDSDLHVADDYLERLVTALAVPGTGLVTTLCSGLPTASGLGAALGVMHITHSFLPGALLSRALGRQDCLGTTMALRRDTLSRIGGLGGLAVHLAEDNVLGQRVRGLGLNIALADTVPATAVSEPSLAALWQHELRWARTIRTLEPCGFAASTLQYPLFWCLLALTLSGAADWSAILLGVAWAVRAGCAIKIDRAVSSRQPLPLWLLPLRDLMSVAEIVVSFLGARVVWRGHIMQARPAARLKVLAELEPEGMV
ncbi:bacteriohopanetetrol glucosamine biosynthesis glycosyltransferase HpnI [Lichenicoccus sp.]|uniref:bacteriohopanetetrol glucosamine biosynthesis glycosyltransferase HpnI n=1 Tax=Lichenicoccus sp. TaxID=2781899 RepID=UPI003D130F78